LVDRIHAQSMLPKPSRMLSTATEIQHRQRAIHHPEIP
jgi:hypothetical protein